MRTLKASLVLSLVLALTWFSLPAQTQTAVANNAADMAGKIVMVADSTTARTVTNLFTFDRDPSAPFAVSAASGKVSNLDADLLDGLTEADFARLAQNETVTGLWTYPAGTVSVPGITVGANAGVGVYSSGTDALDFATNEIKALGIDSTQFIDSPTQPRVSAYMNAVQSIPNTTFTALTLDSEDFDVGALHDNVTNNSRITIPTGADGVYLVTCIAPFVASASGTVRKINLQKNGSFIYMQATSGVTAATASAPVVTALLSLVATDYIQCFVYQDTGGALDVGAAAGSRAAQVTFQTVKLW